MKTALLVRSVGHGSRAPALSLVLSLPLPHLSSPTPLSGWLRPRNFNWPETLLIRVAGERPEGNSNACDFQVGDSVPQEASQWGMVTWTQAGKTWDGGGVLLSPGVSGMENNDPHVPSTGTELKSLSLKFLATPPNTHKQPELEWLIKTAGLALALQTALTFPV